MVAYEKMRYEVCFRTMATAEASFRVFSSAKDLSRAEAHLHNRVHCWLHASVLIAISRIPLHCQGFSENYRRPGVYAPVSGFPAQETGNTIGLLFRSGG